MNGPAAPVDSAVLETMRNRLRTHSLVAHVRTESTGASITTVVAVLDPDRYPEDIERVRVEIQWYKNGDYNFHYIETHTSQAVWQCRWDRHPNPHATRTHFHPPPEARSTDAVDDHPESRQPMAMLTRTLANIRDRLDQHWA